MKKVVKVKTKLLTGRGEREQRRYCTECANLKFREPLKGVCVLCLQKSLRDRPYWKDNKK